MKKIIPFRPTERRSLRKPRTNKDQAPPADQADQEGTITIMLTDGTVRTISGKNLVADVQYKDGVPYLIVKERP